MGVNKEKFKDILKEFIASQQSYKEAIKNYYRYHNIYTGVKLNKIPESIKNSVVKCRYSLPKLQKKSNEVRLILNWLHNYQLDKTLEVDSNLPKSVKKTINKIISEIVEKNFIHIDAVGDKDANPADL